MHATSRKTHNADKTAPGSLRGCQGQLVCPCENRDGKGGQAAHGTLPVRFETKPTTCDAGKTAPRSLRDVLLDWAERAVVLTFYGWLVVRILTVYTTKGSAGDLILLPSEGLVVLLILIRRTTTDVSKRPADWMLAFSATTAPLLVHPSMKWTLLPPAVGVSIMLVGMLIQVHAKIVLGRSMGLVAANRGLKLEGPYRCIRHPMYAGYLLTHLGFLMMNPSGWNLAVYALCYALQIPRLLAEERLLCRDPRYAKHIAKVRYRLLPGVF